MSMVNPDVAESPTVLTLGRGSWVREDATDPSAAPFEPLPKPSDPFETKIQEPDGDPYDYFLKTMIEKDKVQCEAWKDEVQNILVFAGLFSAVVTAFIIESCQMLQPDPNDAMVGLLAHIAQRLDNIHSNASTPTPSVIREANFAPSRADVGINVFWFTSLVLSLTAALIGIVTLQWLREHQRYDNAMKPREMMAILNARLHSLKQWYVPEIFAGLPLLLQGALISFFVGMAQYLFSLHWQVAIPVTVVICLPVVFLSATTVLPALQVCILQDPFRLSINNEVPSPCPYKSPQSLIFRRIMTHSKMISNLFTTVITSAYVPIVLIGCVIRKIFGSELPIFRTQRVNLQRRLSDKYPRSTGNICDASGGWISIDKLWLDVRTIYAVCSQMARRDDNDLSLSRTANTGMNLLVPEVYDCTDCFYQILHWDQTDECVNRLYHSVQDLCADAFHDDRYSFVYNHGGGPVHVADCCFAFGQLLCSERTLATTGQLATAAFMEDVVVNNTCNAVETLRRAFMACWVASVDVKNFGPAINARANEVVGRLIINRLVLTPEQLFPMSSANRWLPLVILPQLMVFSQALADKCSRPLTYQFYLFLELWSTTKPDVQMKLRPSPAKTHGGLATYMTALTCAQKNHEISETILLLTNLCRATPHLLQDKPCLLIVASFYIDAVIWKRQDRLNKMSERLIKSILEAYQINKHCESYFGWGGLDDVIDAVYNHHTAYKSLKS